ncbi:MAG: S-layer homology domain-containing protein [Clostridia bacterium]|nr:S-layer homology domain-containing protein [Clostridia bacterium]
MAKGFSRKNSKFRKAMIYLLCFICTFSQAFVLIPSVQAAGETFTISPVSSKASSLPKRFTVISNQSSFTSGNATPYVLSGGFVVPSTTLTVSSITSTETEVSFTLGKGSGVANAADLNGTYSIRIVDPKGTYNVGSFTLGDPSLLGASPSSFASGYAQQQTITLTAANTNFATGQTSVAILNASDVVQNYVGSVTSVDSPTQLKFTLKTGLPSGTYKIRATTGDEVVTGSGLLTVRGTPTISLSKTSVSVGYSATTITVTGTNTGFSSEQTTVSVLDGDGNSTGKAGSPSVASATSLNFQLNTGLTAGTYTVKAVTGDESVQTTLTVLQPSGEVRYQGNTFAGASQGYTSAYALTFSGTNTSFSQGTSQLALYNGDPDSGGTNITSSYVSGTSVSSATSISFTLATGLNAGTYYARVTTGSQVVTDSFVINPISIFSVTYNSDVVSGTNVPLGYKQFQIEIRGTNTLFQSGTTVEIVGQADKTTTLSVVNATNLSFYLKEGLTAATYSIKVDMDGSGTTTNDQLTTNFTITSPSITGISPNSIVNSGSTPITVTVVGQNTHFASSVPSIDITGFSGETISNISASSNTQLTFSLTPSSISSTGTYGISVTTSNGLISETVTLPNSITVNSSGITISPSTIYTGDLGTATMTITGTNTNFNSSNTTVAISGHEGNVTATIVSTTSITFTAPTGLSAGSHTVTVTQGETPYTTNFLIFERSIALSVNTKIFDYTAFDMTVTGSGVTFDTGTKKPAVAIVNSQDVATPVTLLNSGVASGAVTFAFPLGLEAGNYRVRLSWSSGDYLGLNLESAFVVQHRISSLVFKHNSVQTDTVNVDSDAVPFSLQAWADGEDYTNTVTWSLVSGVGVVTLDTSENKGRVTVVGAGTAVVRASYDGQIANCTINVTQAEPEATPSPSGGGDPGGSIGGGAGGVSTPVPTPVATQTPAPTPTPQEETMKPLPTSIPVKETLIDKELKTEVNKEKGVATTSLDSETILNKIEAMEVKDGENAKKVVTIVLADKGVDTQEVVIGKDTINTLVSKKTDVVINSSKAALTIPSDVFKEHNGGTLKVDIKTINKDEKSQIVSEIPQKSMENMEIKGNILEFTIKSIENKEEKLVSKFNQKVQVQIAVDRSEMKDVNPKRLGVYYLDEDKMEWIYVGGKYDVKTGTVKTKVDHFTKFTIIEYSKTFSDIKDGYWGKEYIEVLASRHVIKGMDENKFIPDGRVTRAQFATFIAKSINLPMELYTAKFKDVREKDWFMPYVEAASKAGIVSGVGNGSFKPNDLITREQMAKMVMVAYQYVTGNKASDLAQGVRLEFSDMNKTSGWAVDYIRAAYRLNVISGMSKTMFSPKENAQRAQSAAIIVKLLTAMDEI